MLFTVPCGPICTPQARTASWQLPVLGAEHASSPNASASPKRKPADRQRHCVSMRVHAPPGPLVSFHSARPGSGYGHSSLLARNATCPSLLDPTRPAGRPTGLLEPPCAKSESALRVAAKRDSEAPAPGDPGPGPASASHGWLRWAASASGRRASGTPARGCRRATEGHSGLPVGRSGAAGGPQPGCRWVTPSCRWATVMLGRPMPGRVPVEC